MSEWISVKDRLPSDDIKVVLLLRDKTLRVAFIYFQEESIDKILYGKYYWYACDNDYETIPYYKVEKWFPLPEIPE